MKSEDTAFLLWVFYRLFSVLFMCMFLAGLTIGIFLLVGINPYSLQWNTVNFLLLAGTGGIVLMSRADKEMERLINIATSPIKTRASL